MRKLVRGGSDEARLVPYEGEDMAKREKLTDKERQGIYTMHCMGESNGAIADRYEIAVSTVYRIIREQRAKKEEGMAGGQQIVAGDKANGRLMSCSYRNRFEGTCIVGGKSKKKDLHGGQCTQRPAAVGEVVPDAPRRTCVHEHGRAQAGGAEGRVWLSR